MSGTSGRPSRPQAKVDVWIPRRMQQAMQDATRPESTQVPGQRMFGASYVASACAIACWELIASRLDMRGATKETTLARVREALAEAVQEG